MTRLLALVSAAAAALVVAVTAAAAPFPDAIELPNGFQPEGIAVGRGDDFYVGSIPTGAIYRGDLRTGAGAILVPPQTGRMAAGLEVDNLERIFVAGAFTGQAYVYDARSGASLAAYRLAPQGTGMINDVVVTNEAAWFTDSFRAVLYRVPLAPNGELDGEADVKQLPLAGDFEPAPGFNLNGIAATPNGETLLVVQTNLGRLYRIDPASGDAELVDLAEGELVSPDGILLEGRTLYVVQSDNRIAVVRLSPDFASGEIVRYLTNAQLDVPATIAEHGERLYAVNARFGIDERETATYSVVQLRR